MRIGLLGDDRSQTVRLGHCLLAAGHIPYHYDPGADLVKAVDDGNIDALVLSYSAPGESGVAAISRVRQELRLAVPVLLIAPHKSERYVVNALFEGADDYMPTPVRDREFLARVEAIARRLHPSRPASRAYEVGRIQVDVRARRISLDRLAVDLTAKDFDLAVFLLRNIGHPLSRTRMLRVVWGSTKIKNTRTLDTHISRVRTKLQLTEVHGWSLKALYRRGYRLERLGPEDCPPFDL